MTKTKEIKVKKSLDERIKVIEDHVSNLDYTNGIQEGLKIYTSIKRDIGRIEKELGKIEEEFKNDDVDIYSDDIDITDKEFSEYVSTINDLTIQIKEAKCINEKIEIYNEIKRLTKICQQYQENIKMQIVKLDDK